jgi:hypothetical protein
MDVFALDRSLISDYATFARSFTTPRAPDLRQSIDEHYRTGRFWPEPLLQLNPHYKPSGWGRTLQSAHSQARIPV